VLLTLKVTHEDLADLVGASRQRTTVQLKEFERERALIRDGRRMIIVPSKLMRITQMRVDSGPLPQPPLPVHSSAKGNLTDAGQQIRHHKRSPTPLSGSRPAR
jgi:hypothetical protein